MLQKATITGFIVSGKNQQGELFRENQQGGKITSKLGLETKIPSQNLQENLHNRCLTEY